MTVLLVAAGGIFTGWMISILSDAVTANRHSTLFNDLQDYRPSKEDLVDWDHHTSGGRRG